ncbi:MAG: exonuclease SbcCD subunit D [Candidatus Thermoplasmatota archaeon]|nr:exonuclease SbcCD subunit D [Candidatus Thermoplasmatota archaeon]
MRILHMADTHLGYAAYGKMDENGLNQRESDIYIAFERAVSLAIREKVDAVLHAGDLFDSVRPSNRAISFALEQIRILEDKEVPFIAISGNHSTPRLRETGSVFSILSILPNFYGVFKGRYQPITIDDLHVHAIPHCPAKDVFQKEVEQLKPGKGGYQVAMLHAGVVGLDRFSMGEANENICSLSPLAQEGFDYVAMGHFHRHSEVGRNIVYSGSTERMSFAEAGEKKGCVLVNLDKRKWEFRELETRKMLDLGPVKYAGQTSGEMEAEITFLLDSTDLDGGIARLTVENVPRSIVMGMNHRKIRSLSSNALHFQPRFFFAEEEHNILRNGSLIRPVISEFEDFMADYSVENMEKERLSKLGKEYLDRAGGGG